MCEKDQADNIIVKHHYSKKPTKNSFLNLLVYYNDKVSGALQIGYGIRPEIIGEFNKGEVVEFDRMWLSDEMPKFSETITLSLLNKFLKSRYKDLKRYILDHVEDVDIYGKWNENIISKDSRFKGPKKFNELQSMLPRVKYTFCIPIKKGWCTAKYWEMSHYGIIPFLHPTYDEQHNIKCPDFLRIKDSKDLFDKISYLENDDVAYAK